MLAVPSVCLFNPHPMRLLFLIVLFPLCLFSQEVRPSAVSPEESFWEKQRGRIGLRYSSDLGVRDPYTAYQNVFVGVPDRGEMLDVQIGCAILAKEPFLRAHLQLGYYQTDFSSGTAQSFNLLLTSIAFFQEKIEYDYFQLGVGLQVEPFTAAQFSPYLAGTLLVALPTRSNYEYSQTENRNLPERYIAEGGALPSIGGMLSAGVRIRVHRHWCAKIGAYFIDQTMKVAWPTVVGRHLNGSVLRSRNAGLNLEVQYCW